MKATVLIPTTGDRGPLLPYSVGSVLRQTIEEIEIFVMGDGVTESTRQTISKLIDGDPRIRFFDHPKNERRGEIHRHAALAEARGRIVCYLCDRDLMLPDHVETLLAALADSDFAHTMIYFMSENGPRFRLRSDVTDESDRSAIASGTPKLPLSFVGHTLEMYRKLPYGWRTTPEGIFTDHYMWQQFLAHPECRAASSDRPTILYLPRGGHPGWPVERRLTELADWHRKLSQREGLESFTSRLVKAARRHERRGGL